MASSVFNIGVSGLNAANLGLVTTGHNIANTNTPGYSRQYLKQSAPYPQYTGSGFVGLGVKVDSIQRVYDQFLTRQVQTAQSAASYLQTYLSHLEDIDNIVADPTTGVSPALQNFFSAVQNVATKPADTAARSALLASAQSLVTRFQTIDDRLSELYTDLNGELTNTVASINALGKQIATLNKEISVQGASGQPPNDLLDQRDQLLKELNSHVKATTVMQSDGTMNVFIGNGQNLVVGGNSFDLGVEPSQSDPSRLSVVYYQGGNTIYLPESQLVGGDLQGLLEFRSKSLDLAKNNLAQVALGFAQTFNAQHRAGQDLNGNIGGNMFDFPRANSLTADLGGATVNITAPANGVPLSDYSLTYDGTNYTLRRLTDNQTATITPAQMAAGYSALGTTLQLAGAPPAAAASTTWSFPPALGDIDHNTLNTGNAQIGGYINDVSKLTTSAYELGFDGANYVVTRKSDGVKTTYTPAQMAAGIDQDGLTLRIDSGTMNAGDRFTIKPLDGLVRGMSVAINDPRQVAAAAPIVAAPDSNNTGKLTITQPTVNKPPSDTTSGALDPAVKNPVTIQFTSATTYTITDTVTGVTSAPQTYTAGTDISFNGWTMKMDGVPAVGDKVNITPNVAGSADGRNALALGALQTTRILNGGTSTYQEAYGQMVATIGIQTNEASVMSEAQDTILAQAETARDSVSGVNIDEEAANLLRYQQAYVAASKVIQIAKETFDQIANIA
ncbi:flagellar hook-associated protein FlgK [Chitiniphilus shinanonensis]|uniref:Flagellar hook-associated protein 1 n=1 Tax=Chitiniphilus shinanonensis TaxID=553088 RepID=A0ABQ6BRB3_9NEIS|nr:flagellar hook-associated protein FlgK [Chitiniphilus shinanonensis]GLS04341.1 flagellar hook-associated protein FlgK [Chitiniphilus shinanonensis]